MIVNLINTLARKILILQRILFKMIVNFINTLAFKSLILRLNMKYLAV